MTEDERAMQILKELCENGEEVDIDFVFENPIRDLEGDWGKHWDLYARKCHLYVLKWHEKDPTLTPVRGFYFCPVWRRDRQHWWLRRPDGTVFDPTKTQFPSSGAGLYQPFEELEFECDECGASVPKEMAGAFHHNYTICSDRCYGRLVGF
jgi:hypothetical protein